MKVLQVSLVCLCALMCPLWMGCGEKKESAKEATSSEAAEPAEEESEEAEEPLAYTPPKALSPAEVATHYGEGKFKKAKKLNTTAIKARRKGDTAKAMTKYKEALAASPGYITARFNLACEYARFGKADEAIAELEHLFKMGTPKALKRIAKLKTDKDFDPIREDPRIKALSKLMRIYSVDWEVTQKDPSCVEGCAMTLKVLVDRDGKERKPIKVAPSEGAEHLSFSVDTDHYGHCVDKDKELGEICAAINFDCGDSCYQDKIVVRAAGEGAKRVLEVVRYEGCLGGTECPEESATVHTMPIRPYDQVMAKKHNLDAKVAASAMAKSFVPADLRRLYHPSVSLSVAGKKRHSYGEIKGALDSKFGRDTYEGDWEEDFDEGFDGWHLGVPEAWECKKLCCSADPGEPMCAGSASPPYVKKACFKKAAGRLALKSLAFASCDHGGP